MAYAAYLRWGTIAALFAVIFVPFVIADGGASWASQPLTSLSMPNMFFPFITGKNFIFRILVEIALVLYVLLALKMPQYRPRASMIMWALVGLVAWMGLATIFSADPTKSFWSNFERMEGYVSLLHLFAFFVIAGAVLSAERLWERFLMTSVGASAYMGLLALLQIMGALPISSQSGPRADTTFGNATYLAVYMLMHFFLTLYLLSRDLPGGRRGGLSRGMQAFYGVALVLQGMGIYYTQTRGALLGLVGGLVVAALWVAVRGGAGHAGLRRWALGGLAGLAVLAGAFVLVKDTALVQSSDTLARLASISLDDRTTQSRFLIWEMALRGAAERPVLGWGQENFSYVFNKYYDPQMYNQESWFDRAHNQFLDFLIGGGVPAFVLYLSLYVLAALAVIRSQIPVPGQAALLGLLAGYAFNNLFVFDNLVSAAFFFAILAFAHGLSQRELPGRLALTRPASDRALAVAAPLVALAVLAGGWALNAPGMARAQLLTAAVSVPPQDALGLYTQALGVAAWPGSPLGTQEAAEQMMQYVPRLWGLSDADPALKQEALAAGTAAGEALLAQRKDDARLELFMSTMLGQTGNNAEAIAHAEKAIALSPNKQQIYFQLGGLYIQAGNTPKALEALKKAFDLAPEYDHARIMYAGAHYYTGDTGRGDAILQEHFGTTAVDNDQLLRIYMDTGMFGRAAAIYEARVEREPSNVELRISLANVYLRSGNVGKTVEALREIIKIRPDLAAQVEQLIAQIQGGIFKP